MEPKHQFELQTHKAGADQESAQFMLLGFDPASVLEGELEIQALDAFATMANLIPPSVPYSAQLNGENLGWRKIQKHDDAVQIHFVPPGHYLVSQQHNGFITIHDSLWNARRIQQILSQLKVLYLSLQDVMDPYQLLTYVVAQSQGCTADCGVFAASNALLLISGGDPRDVTFCQQLMRQHLYQCLRSQTITPFPCNVNLSAKRKILYQESKVSKLGNDEPPKKVMQLRNQNNFYQSLFRSKHIQHKEDKNKQEGLSCTVTSRTATKERDRARKRKSRVCVEQKEREASRKKTWLYREREKEHKQGLKKNSTNKKKCRVMSNVKRKT